MSEILSDFDKLIKETELEAQKWEKEHGEEEKAVTEDDLTSGDHSPKEEIDPTPDAPEPQQTASDPEDDDEEIIPKEKAAIKFKLSEERRRREKLELEMAEMRGMLKARQEPVAASNNSVAPSPAVPDKNLDPIGYLEYQVAEQEKKIAKFQEDAAQLAFHRQIDQAKHAIRGVDEEYEKVSPGYLDKKEFLRKKFFDAQRTLNPKTVPDHAITQWLDQQEATIAKQALDNGYNPAEVFNRMADDMGYEPSKKVSIAAKADIDKVRQNKARSASFVGAPSVEKAQGITPDEIYNMDFKDISKLKDEDWAKVFDRVNSGGRPY